MTILESYYRLPAEFMRREPRLAAASARSDGLTDEIRALYAARPAGISAARELSRWVDDRLRAVDAPAAAQTSLTTLVDDLRLERYQSTNAAWRGSALAVKAAYYSV